MGDGRRKGGKQEGNSKRQAFVICYCLSSSQRNKPNNVSWLPFNLLQGLKQNFICEKSQTRKFVLATTKKKTALLRVKLEIFDPSHLHNRSWMRQYDTCTGVSTVSVVSVSLICLANCQNSPQKWQSESGQMSNVIKDHFDQSQYFSVWWGKNPIHGRPS